MTREGLSRIAIFGGTFDPVHHGHLIMAQDAVESFGLDRLVFVPARKNPLKTVQPQADDLHRIEMIRMAIAGHEKFSVSDVELVREEPSFALTTVEHFREKMGDGELLWLIGADQLPGLHRWYRVAELAKMVTFLVMTRPGYEIFTPEIPNFKMQQLPERQLDISATEIRLRAAGNLSLDYFLPASVTMYIKQSGLYQLESTPHTI